MSTKEKVRAYYLAATSDYLRYYETDWHHHMHYGFDRNLPKSGNPTEHLVRYAAEVGGIPRDGRVLDVGCGVGGTGMWLAENLGTRSTGLNLMEFQLRLAKGFSAAKKLSDRADFAAGDFTLPPFLPNSFDAIIAIESFDHAPDKRAFIKTMATLLRPGGRLILVDGFRGQKIFSPQNEKAYGKFLAGWAVPHLCTVAEARQWAAEAGLREIHGENITADVIPHAFAIYRFGLLFIPWRKLLRAMGLTTTEKLGNAVATYHQYQTLRQGLWEYGIYVFTKPG